MARNAHEAIAYTVECTRFGMMAFIERPATLDGGSPAEACATQRDLDGTAEAQPALELDPGVVAAMQSRAEKGLAECQAGLALDGGEVLDRLFPIRGPHVSKR